MVTTLIDLCLLLLHDIHRLQLTDIIVILVATVLVPDISQVHNRHFSKHMLSDDLLPRGTIMVHITGNIRKLVVRILLLAQCQLLNEILSMVDLLLTVLQ